VRREARERERKRKFFVGSGHLVADLLSPEKLVELGNWEFGIWRVCIWLHYG